MQVKFSGIGSEPISLTTAKAYLRVSSDDDDMVITSLITSAREFIEELTNLSLVVKTIEVFYLDYDTTVKLPFPEHDTITECKVDGVDVLSSIYQTGLTSKIINVPASSMAGNDAGLYVKYTTTGTCTNAIKDIILKVIQELYDNRGNSSYDIKENIKYDVLLMVQPYRVLCD